MTALTKQGAPRRRVAPGASMQERIYLHTDRSGDCWIWTAAISNMGYGRIYMSKRLHYAHRVAYEAFVGPIPKGWELDHLCHTAAVTDCPGGVDCPHRRCVNPLHLQPVTPAVNVRRGRSTGAQALRRDVCLYGHPYAEHGVVWTGRRQCRLCNVVYLRLYKQLPYVEVMRRKREGIPVVDLAAYFAEHPIEAAA